MKFRMLGVCLLSAVLYGAPQTPADPLTGLAQAAGKKAADWEIPAKTVETRVARMLPCDPRVRTAIEEVSKASEDWIAALAEYLQAAAAKAKSDTDAAKLMVANQETRIADLRTDRAEAEQERVAIDGQLAVLDQSATQRPPLEQPRKILEGIARTARERAAQAEKQVNPGMALSASLRDLVIAAQAYESALRDEITAVTEESKRWRQYYAARLSRAQFECNITNQSRPRTPRTKK